MAGMYNNVEKSHVTLMDVKHVNPWVSHIKDFASKHGMTYRDAMRSEECKASYKSRGTPVPESKPEPPQLIQPVAVKKTRVKRRHVLVPTSPDL